MTIASDINGHAPSQPPLALIHTTTVGVFHLICNAGALDPQMCAVMQRLLTYFFYGRPAYRPGDIVPTNKNQDSRPVFMLFNRDAVQNMVGIYPCDTGAHHNNLYSPYMQNISYEDLNCVAVPKAEGRIVTRYFGNNARYFFGEELPALRPKPASPTALEYYQLIALDSVTNYDDRSRTIEVTHNSKLLTDALEKVLLPDFLTDDRIVKPIIDRWRKSGKVVESYRPQRQTNAARTVEQEFVAIGLLQGISGDQY